MIVTEKACAKLNISLDITGKRPDGYHDMAMVMQTVSLCDTLTVTETDGTAVTARTNLSYIPSDSRNLAVKAAQLYLQKAELGERGLELRLDKKIPVGAGMAGGSADAAAVLRALNRLYEQRLDREQLLELAAAVGSDVPFCLTGGTVLATGRGEQLQPLPPMPDCRYVICKPSFSISTPELFAKIDRTRLRRHPDTAGLVAAVEQGDLPGISRRMYNVFEDVNERKFRTVRELKSRLLDAGALGTVMTGTGSALFGIFTPETDIGSIAAELGRHCSFACGAENVPQLL